MAGRGKRELRTGKLKQRDEILGKGMGTVAFPFPFSFSLLAVIFPPSCSLFPSPAVNRT
jgi:hypothetical protein